MVRITVLQITRTRDIIQKTLLHTAICTILYRTDKNSVPVKYKNIPCLYRMRTILEIFLHMNEKKESC